MGAMHPAAWQPPAVAEMAAWLPGYEVLSLVGRGGMGAVYKARQPQLDRFVAVKLLPVEVSLDEAFAQRFRREAQMLARLDHPNIVRIFDFGETTEGHLFYTMEFVEGEDLQQRLRRGLVDPGLAFAALQQVCAALECAHAQGIVHRDVKPANVLITTDGRVKLADFGLAAPTERAPTERLTQEGAALGTFEYAAPEQWQSQGGSARAASAVPDELASQREAFHLERAPLDHRADIYSVGVMAYELLTGELPRGIFPPPSEKAASDPRYDDVVMRALQQEPAKRWPTVREFREALARAHEEVVLSGGTVFATSSAEKLQEFYQQEMGGVPAAVRVFIEEELLTSSSARDSRAIEDVVTRTGLARVVFDQLTARGLLRLVERHGAQRLELASERLVGVVLSARDERRAGEERVLATAREAKMRAQLTRRNRLALAFGVLALTAVIVSATAWSWNREAERLRAESERRAQSAALARDAALRGAMATRFSHTIKPNAPTASHWDWLVAMEDVGNWLEEKTSADAAFAFYEQQRAELEPRAEAAPAGSLWHWDLAFVLNRLGESHRKRNDYDAALPLYERALTNRRDVFARSPATSRFRRDVISACEHVCESLLAKRQPEPALQRCRELIELVSTPERASAPGGTYHDFAAKVCANTIERAVQLEPPLKRAARPLAAAAAQQLLGGMSVADLPAADQKLLARLKAAQ